MMPYAVASRDPADGPEASRPSLLHYEAPMTDTLTPTPRPVALIILDGYGHNPDAAHNAVQAARTPVMDRLWQSVLTPCCIPTDATWACPTARWATRKSAT